MADGTDRREPILDPILKVLYRAEQGVGDISRTQALEVVNRFQPNRGLRVAASSVASGEALPSTLRLVVKHGGSRAALEQAGFAVRACVGLICAGTLPADRLVDLVQVAGVQSIQLSRELHAYGEPAGSPPSSSSSPGRWPVSSAAAGSAGGAGVLVAFIDTGVDIFHSDFRKGDSTTRIKKLLDLSIPGDTNGDEILDGTGPYGGTEYSEADINAALTSGSFASKDTTGHGTHGLSVAAGDDAAHPGMAPEADLLVVKATRQKGSLGFYTDDIVAALKWVDDQAKVLNEPYVVNLSLGSMFSSHDGKEPEEQLIDSLVGPGKPGKVAVIAAGNDSDNRGSHFRHFTGTAYVGLSNTHIVTVPTYTPNNGHGNNRLLLILWYEGRDALDLSVTPPGGAAVAAPFGRFVDQSTGDGEVVILNMGGTNPENGDIEAIIEMSDWSGPPPTPGDWTITVTGSSILGSGTYHGWLLEESVVGGTDATQQLTLKPGTTFDSQPTVADNSYLVGRPGSSYNSITVGSYAKHQEGTRFLTSWHDLRGDLRVDSTAIDGKISDFSSPGPTRDGRRKPEVTAPGERVMGAVSKDAYPGQSPASVYQYRSLTDPIDALIVSNSTYAAFGMLQGTSFSAPVVTGLVARVLAQNSTLDAVQVRNTLVNSAKTDAATGTGASDAWGYGKADLELGKTVQLASDLRVTVDAVPAGALGEPYSVVFTASGGTLPYTWSLASGLPPVGMGLVPSGLLSGTPTATGSSPFTVQVTDGSNPQKIATHAFVLTVAATAPLQITTNLLPVAHLDEPYNVQLRAVGGVPPYSWWLTGGDLPPGLQLGAGGTIFGTPASVSRLSFTVSALDQRSARASRSLSCQVSGATEDNWVALGTDVGPVFPLVIDPGDPDHLMCRISNWWLGSSIFESVDGGRTWSPTIGPSPVDPPGWGFLATMDLAILPQTGAAAVSWLGGVFAHERSSQTWRRIDDRGTRVGDYWGLTVDETTNTLVTAWRSKVDGANAPLEFSSTHDLGDSWNSLAAVAVVGASPDRPSEVPGQLATQRADPELTYFTSSLMTPGLENIRLRSDDGGSSWQRIDTGSHPSRLIAPSEADPLEVLTAGSDGANLVVDRSHDGGTTWSSGVVATNAEPSGLRRAPSRPEVVYLAAGTSLYRSDTSGENWLPLPLPRQFTSVFSLDVDPSDPSRVFIGSEQGVFVSEDGGGTWAPRNKGLDPLRIDGLIVGHEREEDIFLREKKGVYLSRNAGSRWLRLPGLPNGVYSLAIGAHDDREYAIQSKRVLRSDNGGLSWTPVDQDLNAPDGEVPIVAASPFLDDFVLVGHQGGLSYSLDGGYHWHLYGTGLPRLHPSAIAFARDAPNRLFVSYSAFDSSGGVWESTTGGILWHRFGLDGQYVVDVRPAPSDSNYLYALAWDDSLYSRDPTDENWRTAKVCEVRAVAIAIDPNDPKTAYVGCAASSWEMVPKALFKTTDEGRTFTPLPGPLNGFGVAALATHSTSSGVVYAAGKQGGVFRSNDGGTNWTPLSTYGTIADVANVAARDPSNELGLFAGTEGYGVQASVDGGRTFSSRSVGLTNYNVKALAFDAADSARMYAGTDSGLFLSTNSGTTWSVSGLAHGRVTGIVTDSDGTARRIWVTVAGEGVSYSPNGGTTFSTSATGLTSLDVSGLALERVGGSARRIWVTTNGGDGVAFSDDLGKTWISAAGNGLTDRRVNDLAIDGTARRIWVTTNSGVFFSEDSGSSWRRLSSGLPVGVPVRTVSVDPFTGEALVGLSDDQGGGVYRGGLISGRWREFGAGLSAVRINKLTSDGGRVVDPATLATTFYAATEGDGVYEAELQTAAGPSPVVATTSLPRGYVHGGYSAGLSAAGGLPPYHWTVVEGTLPAGLTLDAVSGMISGEPVQPESLSFSVQVADSQRLSSRTKLTLTVLAKRPVPIRRVLK